MAGIYVHVPFCKQKCSYCDFASFPREIGKAEAYFACLYKELKARSLSLKDKKFSTVYFGGGTPSFVEPKYIYGALKQIYTCFNVDKNAEITLEVNPGTIDENKLKVYKNAGVNRFSVGLQTANDKTLYSINRIHTVEDFKRAIELLKDYNVSVDVMIGLPDETVSDVKNTLDLATSYPQVKHVSVYALKAEEGTPMFTRYLNGELPDDDEVADIYDFVVDYLSKKGYNRYEVSNFAKEGYQSKHNKNYWARGEYIGVGVGASSFIEGRRFTNTESIDEYVHAILNGKVAEVFSENVCGDDAKAEYAMLALRTANGVDFNDYKNAFGSDFSADFKNSIKANGKYLDILDSCIKIKDKYLYVQNSILVDFISEKQ
ncbi:MAG: radical SAM family heme chaperone HemW [Clostridia bacterium]|nr:radical SAM family heme chaperone HemW [Clostridia bacterium]